MPLVTGNTSQQNISSTQHVDCSICSEPIGTTGGGVLANVSPCSHEFCEPCVQDLIKHAHHSLRDATCPNCRVTLRQMTITYPDGHKRDVEITPHNPQNVPLRIAHILAAGGFIAGVLGNEILHNAMENPATALMLLVGAIAIHHVSSNYLDMRQNPQQG